MRRYLCKDLTLLLKSLTFVFVPKSPHAKLRSWSWSGASKSEENYFLLDSCLFFLFRSSTIKHFDMRHFIPKEKGQGHIIRRSACVITKHSTLRQRSNNQGQRPTTQGDSVTWHTRLNLRFNGTIGPGYMHSGFLMQKQIERVLFYTLVYKKIIHI